MDDEADKRVVELWWQQRRKVVEHCQQHLPRQLTMVVGRVSHVYFLSLLSLITFTPTTPSSRILRCCRCLKPPLISLKLVVATGETWLQSQHPLHSKIRLTIWGSERGGYSGRNAPRYCRNLYMLSSTLGSKRECLLITTQTVVSSVFGVVWG